MVWLSNIATMLFCADSALNLLQNMIDGLRLCTNKYLRQKLHLQTDALKKAGCQNYSSKNIRQQGRTAGTINFQSITVSPYFNATDGWGFPSKFAKTCIFYITHSIIHKVVRLMPANPVISNIFNMTMAAQFHFIV